MSKKIWRKTLAVAISGTLVLSMITPVPFSPRFRLLLQLLSRRR